MTLHMKEAQDHLARRVAELHTELRPQPATALARKAGAVYENGRFHLHIWGQPITIVPPNFLACDAAGQELEPFSQALLAYYLHTTNGAPLAGEWIAFTELPDAQFYTAAFQGYTGAELAKQFGNDLEGLAATAVALEGQPVAFADCAYQFRVLPHVAVMVACWQGDEEFSPSYRILFDANTRHHLPTDACAIIGSTLTRWLIRGYNRA
jgi:hypothetical protein